MTRLYRIIYIFIALFMLAAFLVLNEMSSKVTNVSHYARNYFNSFNKDEAINETTLLHDARRVSKWPLVFPEEFHKLSNLGRRLFLGENIKPHNTSKQYKIAVWKHGERLLNRLIRHYGKVDLDPFDGCSVNNCKIYINDSDTLDADAVMFHLHLTEGPNTLPKHRETWQRWVFLSDESPHHTFMVGGPHGMQYLSDYNGIFNWSMMYRTDADVPALYGRTVKLATPRPDLASFDYAGNKTRFVAILGSNCGGSSKRWKYVKELQKHIDVDVYGRCGKLKCPGHYGSDCVVLQEYKFYLAFENSICNQYITEKAWFNAFSKSIVPVVLGTRKSDYEQLLPPNSFIHVDDYPSPEALAKYLIFLNYSSSHYNEYFQWKSEFQVLNEHGYFQTTCRHYCRLCEALNYNDEAPKVYDNLSDYWSVEKSCYPSKFF